MSRRFEVGPMLVALGALVLLVSLFLEWYGALTAWEAFEVVELLLTALAIAALVAAAGLLVPDVQFLDRRWLPAVVAAALVLVIAAVLDPPPAATGSEFELGLWIAFAAALVMGAGAVLTFARVSFSFAVEDRDVRERVAVVDHRQDTAETAAVPDPAAGKPTEDR